MAVDEPDAVGDDAVGDRHRLLGIADVVLDGELDLAAHDAALGVDRGDGGLGAVLELVADGGELAGHRPDHREVDVVGQRRRGKCDAENGSAQDCLSTSWSFPPLLSGSAAGSGPSSRSSECHFDGRRRQCQQWRAHGPIARGDCMRLRHTRAITPRMTEEQKSRAGLVPAGRGFPVRQRPHASPRPCPCLFPPPAHWSALAVAEAVSKISASSSIRAPRAAPGRFRPSTSSPKVPHAAPRRGTNP